MGQKLYRCSKCNAQKSRSGFHEAKPSPKRRREVTSRCKTCRSEARYEILYPDTICMQCERHRPLDRNRICQPCNEESGLRQCRGPCGEVLPMYLKFYGHRQICKDCVTEPASEQAPQAQQGLRR